MGEKLSSTDAKILAELLYNSRQSLSSLAKKMRMSKQLVAYKIGKLVERRYINAFITVVDRSRIGYTRYNIYLNVLPMPKEQEKKILKEILSLGAVVLSKCEVRWNLIVGLLAKDIEEFAEKNSRLREILKGKLINSAYSIHLRTITCCPQIFAGVVGKSKIAFTFGDAKKCEEIDEKDELILSAISTNARASYAELSELTGLPPETIRYRLRLLEKKKIILGYTFSINPNLEGLHYYRIFVSLHTPTQENIRKVTAYLLNLKQIRRVMTVIFYYNIIYDIRVSGGEELRKIKREVENKFHSIMQSQISVRVFDEMRFCHFPPLEKKKE